MTRPRRTHLALAITLALCGSAAAAVLLTDGVHERDRARLDRAMATHQADVERAANIYRTAVERANGTLERVYSELIRRYEQRGETTTAEALRRELAEALASADPAAQEGSTTPTAPRGHTDLLASIGGQLTLANGNAVDSAALGEKEYVLLYFSAAWCGPCRAFTPQLRDFHRDNAQRGSFEVVLVSSDRSANDMLAYMRDANMQWPAIPYERVGASRLQQTHRVTGIPRLVVMGRDGQVVLSGQSGAAPTLREFGRMIGAR